MFTGIIEEIGRLTANRIQGQSGQLHIRARKVLDETGIGESVAVNGVCLTLTALHADGFQADIMPETLRATSLGFLRPGDPVNLERALEVGKRVGGHFVTGHVDGLGRILSRTRHGNAVILRIRVEPGLLRSMIVKGSVAVEGTSLTIMNLDQESFSVSLVPHTLEASTLGDRRPGDLVNVEADHLAKLAADTTAFKPRKELDLQVLRDCGFC